MPAKKKSAAKKTTRKTAAKKAAESAKNKTATKAATKRSGKASSKKSSSASKSSSSRSGNTPNIFRPASRKPGPVAFSMDEVRELLKQKKKEAQKEKAQQEAEAEATAQRKEAKPVEIDESQIKAGKHGAASLADILGFGSVSTPTKTAVPRNERTVPKKWTKFHRMLVELRDHVRQGLSLHSSDTLKRSQKEDAGDISTSADAGTDNFDRDFALSMLSSEQEALKEIEAAIERIYNGTYGICEVTGDKISLERLEAVPFTRFSLQGQLEYERTARKRVQRTGAFLAEGSAENVSFGDDDSDG